MKADCRSLKQDQANLVQDDEGSQDLLFDCDEYAEIWLAAMIKYSRLTYYQEIIKLERALLPPKEVQVFAVTTHVTAMESQEPADEADSRQSARWHLMMPSKKLF